MSCARRAAKSQLGGLLLLLLAVPLSRSFLTAVVEEGVGSLRREKKAVVGSSTSAVSFFRLIAAGGLFALQMTNKAGLGGEVLEEVVVAIVGIGFTTTIAASPPSFSLLLSLSMGASSQLQMGSMGMLTFLHATADGGVQQEPFSCSAAAVMSSAICISVT